MFNQKKDTANNDSEKIIYAVVGGAMCCYFVPSYIPIFVFGGGLLLCTSGIIDVLKKEEQKEEINFVEKEKIEFFKNEK